MNQRPRSASVPPRAGDQRPNSGSSNQQPTANSQNNQASSARSSPHRIPRFPSFGNLDFEVSTHIDVVPMMMTPQGMVPLGSTRPPPHAHNINMPNQNANSTPAAEGMEPSLAHLLRNLQRNRNNPNSEDANMFQVVMVSLVEQK